MIAIYQGSLNATADLPKQTFTLEHIRQLEVEDSAEESEDGSAT